MVEEGDECVTELVCVASSLEQSVGYRVVGQGGECGVVEQYAAAAVVVKAGDGVVPCVCDVYDEGLCRGIYALGVAVGLGEYLEVEVAGRRDYHTRECAVADDGT